MLALSSIILLASGAHGEPDHSVAESRYPIRPVSLRSLCERADSVAIVRPGPRISVETPSEWRHDGADLEVVQVLHGKDLGGVVQVSWFATGCPAPPHLPEGELRLVFLSESEPGAWSVTGRSYGSKSGELLDAYRSVVDAWFALDSDDPEFRVQEYAWTLSLLDHPGLVHEALRDLSGFYWSGGWYPGKFSADAEQEDALLWLRHFGGTSVLDTHAVAVFPLIHRSSPAAAAAWWWGAFDRLGHQQVIDSTFDLGSDFFAWTGATGMISLDGSLFELRETLERDGVKPQEIAAAKERVRLALLDFSHQIVFPAVWKH